MSPANRFVVITVSTAVLTGLFSGQVQATKKVYSPIIEYRELEVEARGNYDFDSDDAADGLRKQKYAVGYGAFERLFLEIYGEIEKEGEDEYEFESVELEGRYQLFEQGERWLDAGIYAAYEIGLEGNVDKVETKLLLQKEFGRLAHLTNIVFERQVGSGAASDVGTGLGWSSRYRLNQNIEPGIEFHSEFGAIDNFAPYDEQSHLVGPVINGKLGRLKYDIGYLFGISDAAPDGMFKWILEYEFHL